MKTGFNSGTLPKGIQILNSVFCKGHSFFFHQRLYVILSLLGRVSLSEWHPSLWKEIFDGGIKPMPWWSCVVNWPLRSPVSLLKGCKSNLAEGQSWSCGSFNLICNVFTKTLSSEFIYTAQGGYEIFVPTGCLCHHCAINVSTAKQPANLVAVKYPAHCLSPCGRRTPTSHSEGSFDKTHDLVGRNQIRAAISEILLQLHVYQLEGLRKDLEDVDWIDPKEKVQ